MLVPVYQPLKFNDSMDKSIFLAFLAYFFILLIIGLLSYRKQHTDSDFIVGNRSLNFWVIALSAHASDMSSWLFMAFPAAIMIRGLTQSWIAVGLLLGMFANWQFISIPLRTATEKFKAYTLSTFFERRFNDDSGMLRTITAIISVIFLSCYLSAGLVALGLVLESVFEINYYIGLSLATCVVVAYTFIGGFVTVAWTDLFQALFLLAMIIFVPYMAYTHLDQGWHAIVSFANEKKVDLYFLEDFSIENLLTILFLVFGWGLGYFGQPHIITKFMGIKHASEMHKSKYIGMSWMLIALTASAAVGLIGIAYFKEGLSNPELVFVEMVKSLFNPLAAGFILCGMLAAGISTMDSQMLVCASILSEDFYKHLINKRASPQRLLLISRIGVVLIATVALLIAFNHSATILDTVQYAWTGLGAAFGPLVLMSLYSKSANRYGAIGGILCGGLIAGFWPKLNPLLTQWPIPAMIPGFLAGLLSIYMISKLILDKSPTAEV